MLLTKLTIFKKPTNSFINLFTMGLLIKLPNSEHSRNVKSDNVNFSRSSEISVNFVKQKFILPHVSKFLIWLIRISENYSGQKFRESLRKQMPGTNGPNGCRAVPPFSIQSLQKGTCVLPPPRCNPFKENPITKPTSFRLAYQRGDLPIAIDATGCRISWKVSSK